MFSNMLARANMAIREYRVDIYYVTKNIPDDTEARVERLYQKYKAIFSTELTRRPPGVVPPDVSHLNLMQSHQLLKLTDIHHGRKPS